jgi:energy-coupling factor transport system ATP-binding protein
MNLFGLETLNPKPRLLFVIIITSGFAFIKNLEVAIIIATFSFFLLLIGKKIPFKRLLLFLVISNSLYLILGNWLFSPISTIETNKYFIFRINQIGLNNGYVGALKRNSMIFISFAWLGTNTSLYDVYLALNYKIISEKYLVIFLKWLQNIFKDFIILYQSMQVKEYKLRTNNIFLKLKNLVILLKATLNRFFFDIGKMTFNGESHFHFDVEKDIPPNIIIKLDSLDVCYQLNDKPILLDVNFTVHKGEFIFITGENGEGKSTLLKLLSGYIPKIEGYITKGEILISGLNTNSSISLNEINKKLRLIVDNPANSIIGLTVLQELYSQGANEHTVNENIKLFNLKNLLNQDTNTLSGGEVVRVALASLMCAQVNLVIMESPLSQLDNNGKKALNFALTILLQQGVTVIIADTEILYFENFINRIINIENSTINVIDKKNPEYFKHFNKSPQTLKKIKNNQTTKPICNLSNLSFKIEEKLIIKNINLKIFQQDSIAILGSNGSGKSTLMFLLAGLLNASSGEVEIYETNVGFVFQDSSKQILEQTVEDELNIIPKNTNKVINENKITFLEESLKWSGLRGNKETLEMSTSEIKLLEIISNTYNKDLIIFDEPTNGLTIKNKTRLVELIQNLNAKGKTIIAITHDLEFASVFNRFIYMDKSQISLDTNIFSNINKYINN